MGARAGIFGFATAVAVLVPAGWHRLGAGASDDGAMIRPGAESFVVGDATVKVSVDRGIVGVGDRVSLTLVATAEKSQPVDLVVDLLEAGSSPEDRMSPPPDLVDRERVRISAAPSGGVARTMNFRLPKGLFAKAKDPLAGTAGSTWEYTFLVRPASVLDKKHKDGEAEGDDSGDVARAARITVLEQAPEAYALRVEAPEHPPANAPFTAIVHVTNSSKKTLKAISVDLAPAPDQLSGGPGTPILPGGSDDYDIAVADGQPDAIDTLAPGAEATVKFVVTPKKTATGTLTFLATGRAEYGGSAFALGTTALPAPDSPDAPVTGTPVAAVATGTR